MTPSAGVLAAATALTVLAAVAVRGGYPAAFHGAFAALAGLALMAAVLADEREAGRLLRAPAVLVLWAIAALSVLSAAWTVGTVADAVRAGLVAAGYGALAVAGGVIGARARGAVLLSAGLACVAAAAAVWGLLAAGLHAEPWAERIYRRWQPGGPFEYPPALALLQVAALPALLRAMAGGPPRVAAAGAAGGALAASVLALGTSRFGLAAAATIALLALAAPAATVHASRGRVLAAVALLAAAGGVAYAVAGGRVAAGDDSGGAGRVAALSGCVIAAAAIWGAVASRLGRVPAEAAGGRRAAPVLALALAGVSAVALLGAGAGAAAGTSGPGGEGFTHGRTAIWGEALDTWGERPVAGAGAGAYLAASSAFQAGPRVRYAHDLPLELAVELGVLGLLLGLALYAAAGHATWSARGTPALWLLGPGVAAFLAFNLVDWTWHLPGAGAVWAVALGGLLSARRPLR